MKYKWIGALMLFTMQWVMPLRVYVQLGDRYIQRSVPLNDASVIELTSQLGCTIVVNPDKKGVLRGMITLYDITMPNQRRLIVREPVVLEAHECCCIELDTYLSLLIEA